MWSLSMFGTGLVLWVELPVQRRPCPIFVRDVWSPNIHECFRRLTGSQRTPGEWGVTLNKYQDYQIIPLEESSSLLQLRENG